MINNSILSEVAISISVIGIGHNFHICASLDICIDDYNIQKVVSAAVGPPECPGFNCWASSVPVCGVCILFLCLKGFYQLPPTSSEIQASLI